MSVNIIKSQKGHCTFNKEDNEKDEFSKLQPIKRTTSKERRTIKQLRNSQNTGTNI